MKKGFTLIELLAVIIILAVVALIATPIVLNVVDDAKDSARNSKINMYADAVKLEATNSYFTQGGDIDGIIDTEDINNSSMSCESACYTNNKVLLQNCTVDGVSNYYYINGNIYNNFEDYEIALSSNGLCACSPTIKQQLVTSIPTSTGGTVAFAGTTYDNEAYDEESNYLTFYTVGYVTSDNLSTTGYQYSINLNDLPVSASSISNVTIVSSSVMGSLEDFNEYDRIKTAGGISETIPTYSSWAKATPNEMLAHSATSSQLSINSINVTCDSNCVASIDATTQNLSNVSLHSTTTYGGDSINVVYLPIKFTIEIEESNEEETYESTSESCFTFESSTGTITAYDETCGLDVVIPNEIDEYSVTTIGAFAFMGKQLTSVTLPSSITSIGEATFCGNQLTSVEIPDSVITIGEYAFDDNSLISVEIPDSVTTIERRAFSSNQLTSLEIGKGIILIGDDAFNYNENLSIINVSPLNLNYKSINNAIYTKDGETLVKGTIGMANNIEPTTKVIKSAAFECIYEITSVTIPDSVTTIGDYAFSSNKLTSVTIPDSVTTIGIFAFERNLLTSVVIGNSVTSIGSYTFRYNNLTSVTIPNSVTSIGSYAFAYNYIPQGGAIIDNTSGNVGLGTNVFYNNTASRNMTITPTYLR